MKTSFAAVLALFAASSLAAPTPAYPTNQDGLTVSFTLTNDESGANAAATVPVNGESNDIYTLFKGSVVDVEAINSEILATSINFSSIPQYVSCQLLSGSTAIGTFSPSFTFLTLTPDVSEPRRLSGTTITCYVDSPQ